MFADKAKKAKKKDSRSTSRGREKERERLSELKKKKLHTALFGISSPCFYPAVLGIALVQTVRFHTGLWTCIVYLA